MDERTASEIAVYRSIIREWLDAYDPERGVIVVDADPRCGDCTQGTAPHTRPCALHTAQAWLKD